MRFNREGWVEKIKVGTNALFYGHGSSEEHCRCVFLHRQPPGCRDPSRNDCDWPEMSTWPPEWWEIKGRHCCCLSIPANDCQLKQISKTIKPSFMLTLKGILWSTLFSKNSYILVYSISVYNIVTFSSAYRQTIQVGWTAFLVQFYSCVCHKL